MINYLMMNEVNDGVVKIRFFVGSKIDPVFVPFIKNNQFEAKVFARKNFCLK